MAEVQRLRLRIGEHEFDAEGPPEVVQRQLDQWREMVASQPAPSAARQAGTSREGHEGPSEETDQATVSRVLRADRQRNVVTVRALPGGDRRDADAILLILYGFQEVLGQDDALVGRVKESLEQSGIQPRRIDRIVAPHVTSGLVRKSGRGPGGRYWLSNTGVQDAERIIRELGG